ncbi:aminoglycoside phosphotransferase [Hydrocarboniphaga effusa AP103]|uniref:Aminoglycoside phosphotransferase n=2 Tax=Hydrocarboniphaga effusa TaxID=243629 RepID=I8HZX2_9GAMM|nr:phosphotransferase [Hydrocarboniphaga effusa]EIT69221.1 aminoglycoside phosphotransferase [Hydrocarboniphaga effusa AP103]
MTSTQPDAPLDPRMDEARRFAFEALGLQQAEFAPASADASFRRYFRIVSEGRSWVVMDAPPDREDCGPFIHVAGLMQQAGLNGPRILAQDLQRGYLLLSDLGRQTYLHVIDEHNADALFDAAIDALLRWQQSSVPDVLPAYDEALLRRELALFPDWYVARHLRRELTPAQAAAWDRVQTLLVDSALAQARVFVHRDYMPRNLMISEPNPGVLDFQDAVYGPISYDVVCLFKDAFLSWPAARVEAWARIYWERARAAQLPVADDFGRFLREFEWMGVQRHLKVLGIFARINYRDGKPHYLADTPRFIRYLRETASRYAELAPLTQLFDELGLQAP